MELDGQPVSAITTTHSIASLVFGILTVLSFCTGLLPIPFTGFVCFPASLVLGGTAFLFGVISLRGIRKRNESGRFMAWAGVLIGGAAVLCVLCMAAAFVSLIIFAPQSVPVPPLIDRYI